MKESCHVIILHRLLTSARHNVAAVAWNMRKSTPDGLFFFSLFEWSGKTVINSIINLSVSCFSSSAHYFFSIWTQLDSIIIRDRRARRVQATLTMRLFVKSYNSRARHMLRDLRWKLSDFWVSFFFHCYVNILFVYFYTRSFGVRWILNLCAHEKSRSAWDYRHMPTHRRRGKKWSSFSPSTRVFWPKT